MKDRYSLELVAIPLLVVAGKHINMRENVAAAISAAVGGMTATTVLMPLDTIKTRMQSRNDGTATITSTFNDLTSEGGR